jgi:putative transposase
MSAVAALGNEVGIRTACNTLGMPRASYYRWRCPKEKTFRPQPPLGLSREERGAVLSVLHEGRFVDRAPREIYASLLDERTYLCSARTMYRILDQEGEIRERRNQLIRPRYEKPELLATGPNEVWSWDISAP